MNAVHGIGGRVGHVLSAIGAWPDRQPGRQPETPPSHRTVRLGHRIQKKIARFDRTIAAFRQRRWA